jgi:hypothetical protein
MDVGIPQAMDADPAMKPRIGGVNDCGCGICSIM